MEVVVATEIQDEWLDKISVTSKDISHVLPKSFILPVYFKEQLGQGWRRLVRRSVLITGSSEAGREPSVEPSVRDDNEASRGAMWHRVKSRL